MKRMLSLTLSLAAFLVAGQVALAQPAPPPPGAGPGVGPGQGFGRGSCRHLLTAHPDILKAQLGVNDAQAKQIQALHKAYLAQRISDKAELDKAKLEMQTLMQEDLPDEGKVLAQHRKIHAAMGKIAEEGLKTRLKVLKVLTKEQRTKLRTLCPMDGPGGFGKHGPRGHRWGGGGWGKGRGAGGPWAADASKE